ncbi:MAG: hypothetical protein ACRDRX_22115, partial [Pseudonocardiaceae bacterium]
MAEHRPVRPAAVTHWRLGLALPSRIGNPSGIPSAAATQGVGMSRLVALMWRALRGPVQWWIL